MTPNEKAATFIGWKPCQWEPVEGGISERCRMHDFYSMTRHCQSGEPDMSEPENYIQALEAVTRRHWLPYIEADEHFNGITWRVYCGHASYDATDDVTDGNLSVAIVTTLARVFDAEHEEPA